MALTMLVLCGLVAALVVWTVRSVSSDRATQGDAMRTPTRGRA
jgi:hypothetical protein